MKTFFQNIAVFIILVFGMGIFAIGQGTLLPQELVGTDLGQIESELKKAIEQGQDSLTIKLAEVYYYSGKYQEALEQYQKAEALGLIKIPEQKRNFTHAAKMLNVPSPYDVPTGYFNQSWKFETNIKPFCGNSANEDFAPFKWKDLLFITSSRGTSRRIYEFTSKPFLDVIVFSDGCNPVPMPGFLPRNLNTRWHDGPIAVSADTNLVVITRNYSKPNESGFHNLYMEYFVRKNGNWQKGTKFPFANENYSVQHPFFNDKESTLYFASNFEGGYGGFDLYKSKWNGEEWEKPVNLGPQVNSSYDEAFPSFSPDGDLVYSTNHIETTGGLDLVLFKDGLRTLFPEPFNTVYDDFGLTFENENKGYFSSNRSDAAFGDNIFHFEIPEPAPIEYFFIAKVIDKETGQPIEGAMVAFSSYERGISGSMLTDENGLANLIQNVADLPSFQFNVTKNGYNSQELTTNQFEISGNHYIITFSMDKEVVPVVTEVIKPDSGTMVLYFENDVPATAPGGMTAIQNYYDTYKAYQNAFSTYREKTLDKISDLDAFHSEIEEGMNKLNEFVEFLFDELKSGESFLIDLAAYASPLASHGYNIRLTERRNASVNNYLLQWQNGTLKPYIDNGSIKFVEKAYGNTKAPAGISASPTNRSESVYSIKASKERRVVLFWKKTN